MPRRSPFTQLCRLASALADPDRADLHNHSTASDGTRTPSQMVALAARAKLKAFALTDHDSIDGWAEARDAIRENGFAIEFIPGVELTTYDGPDERHLLAYECEPTEAFLSLLEKLRAARRERFLQFTARLGVLSADRVERLIATGATLGRRHLAGLLVESGAAKSRFEAFRRFLQPLAHSVDRVRTISIDDAIALVANAGGWTSLAHPPEDLDEGDLARLSERGLIAVEVEFPAAPRSRSVRLRELCGRLGLGCTGGSDSHGDDRALASRSIPMRDLHDLRRFARR
jgi:predicted metal-dependent phosphoesterase TrpH